MAAGEKQRQGDSQSTAQVLKIKELGDGYALPDGMAAAAYGESRGSDGGAGCVSRRYPCSYSLSCVPSPPTLDCGTNRADVCAGRTGHVEQLRGAVEELRVLETQATVSFYTMQNIFGGD